MTGKETPRWDLISGVALLFPAAAGAAIAAVVNRAIVFPELADRFWHGAGIDPLTAPSAFSVILLCVLANAALWLALARAIRGSGSFAAALQRESWAFLPSMPILALVALDAYGIIPDVMIYSVHAVVFAVAGFIAVNASLLALRQQGESRIGTALEKHAVLTVVLAAAVYWITFSSMGTLQYYAMRISYTDTADWEQMLWNTLRGRFLMSSAFPHMFFGEHVQVIHLLLLPLYAVFPSLVTLMIVKSAVLASGAFPVYLASRERLGSKGIAACLAIAYLLYPAMQYTDLELGPNTFRPEVFAIPALLWAVYFYDKDRMWGLAVSAALAVASKEEMALPVAMIGLLLVLRKRPGWGLAFFAGGIAWFCLTVFIVIPHLRGEASHMTRYYQDFWNRDAAGQLVDTSLRDIILNMVRDPLHTLAVGFRPEKIDYLLLLLVPLGLRPLFSWRMLFIMLPALATTLLASRMPSYNIYWHYQIPLVPFLVMGAVYGVEGCASLLAKVAFTGSGLTPERRKGAARVGLCALVLASSLFGNVLYAKSPISLLFYNSNMETYWRYQYVVTERAKLFFCEVRPLVPPEVAVSATEFAATYFAGREHDFVFPDGLEKADYVVVDLRDAWLSNRLVEKGLTLEKALELPAFERIFDKEEFRVYRRISAAAPDAGLTNPKRNVD